MIGWLTLCNREEWFNMRYNGLVFHQRRIPMRMQTTSMSKVFDKEPSEDSDIKIYRDCPEFCAAYWDEHEPRPPNAPGYRKEGEDATSASRSMTIESSPSQQPRPDFREEERRDTTSASPPPPPRSETFELDDAEGEVDSVYHKRDNHSSYLKDVQRSLSPSPSSFKSSNFGSSMLDQITPSISTQPSKQQETFNEMMDNATAPTSPLPTTHPSSLSEKQPSPSHNHTTLKDKPPSSLRRSPLGEKVSSLSPVSLSKDKATPKVTFKTPDKLPNENEKPTPPPSTTTRNQHHRNYSALLDGITCIPPFLKRQGFIFAKDADYPNHDTHWTKEMDKLLHIQHIETKNQLLAYISW